MERSVQLIVAGGLALVVGLWVLAVGGRFQYAELLGAGLAGAGVFLLASGIAGDLTAWPFER